MIVFFALMGWFYAGNIFLNNTATLRDMFEYAGIIFLFIIPATTMRLLAEESKSGTIELLATKPLHDAEIVLGKFLASWAFIAHYDSSDSRVLLQRSQASAALISAPSSADILDCCS